VDGLQPPDDPGLLVRADAVGPVVGLAVGPVVDRVSRDRPVDRDAPVHRDPVHRDPAHRDAAHRDADQTPMP